MLDYTLRILEGLGERELGSGGAYPPVLPILVYNGKRPWNAPTDVFDLFTPVPGAMTQDRHITESGLVETLGRGWSRLARSAPSQEGARNLLPVGCEATRT